MLGGKQKALRDALSGGGLSRKLTWTLVLMGASALGTQAVKLGLDRGWRAARHEKPPDDPSSREVPWRDAILWTAATGVVMGVSQLLIRRGLVEGWARFTGEDPPA